MSDKCGNVVLGVACDGDMEPVMGLNPGVGTAVTQWQCKKCGWVNWNTFRMLAP